MSMECVMVPGVRQKLVSARRYAQAPHAPHASHARLRRRNAGVRRRLFMAPAGR
jgi:hypothetical protein